jgi:hypothetical protein
VSSSLLVVGDETAFAHDGAAIKATDARTPAAASAALAPILPGDIRNLL